MPSGPDHPQLAWFFAASVAAHLLLLTLLPRWNDKRESPLVPITVALVEKPAPIEPPQPLPMAPQPQLAEKSKATVRRPDVVKPVSQEVPPVVQTRVAPLLTMPVEAPSAPVIVVAPEPKSVALPEAPRPSIVTPVPPPVTPPRLDASYLNNPRPAYPPAARRRGDQGTVLVRVVVTTEGLAASVALQKTSGHPSLDDAALAAVKSWRFVPARQGGQALEAPYVVPIVFKVE